MRRLIAAIVLAAATLTACATTPLNTPNADLTISRVSAPGQYQGWSRELYTEWVRTSQYIPVRDGTRLAVTLYRPAVNGRVVETPYPVVFNFTPYRTRYRDEQGRIITIAEQARSGRPMVDLTRYGYVVAVADIRGKGASFGARRGFLDRTEARDAYDLIEWLGTQSFSTGAVGMWGCSYMGGTQLLAASAAPPHLRAIFTGGSDYDKFNFVRRGGILAQFNTRPDEPPEWDLATVPVDGDTDGSQLRAAVAEHARNTPMAPLWHGMPYRDSMSMHTGTRFWEEVGVYNYHDVIERSNIAIYHWHNLQDEGRGEGVVAAENLRNPGNVLIGPGGHCEPPPNFDLFAEHLRFYDRYLKNIPNGIEQGPRYTYWTHGAQPGQEWARTDHWPPAGANAQSLYFTDGASATLVRSQPNNGQSAFRVDYDVTCGPDDYFLMGPCVVDRSGTTFTTDPLSAPMHLRGNPTGYVWISSSINQANVFIYLEQVAANGTVTILSHGRLSAAYRRVSTAPYNTLGQPWHSGRQQDQETLAPGEVVEMPIAMLPVSQIIPAGARLRFTVTGADPRQRDLQRIRITPAPTLTVHFGGTHPSRVDLPIVR